MGAQMVYLREPVTRKEVHDSGDLAASGLRYGYSAMQGWRRNMEDAHLAVPDLDEHLSLFGVFDGHGGRGVSRFAAKHLPEILRGTQEYKQGDYAKALEKAFLAMDERLREAPGRREVADLDKPDAGAAVQPMVVPKKVLQRFLGRSSEAEEEADSPGGGCTEPGDEAALQQEDGEPAAAPAEASGGADTESEDWAEEEMALVDPARLMRDPTPEAQGCTAVVVLLVRAPGGSRVFCANAGDSRAVLGRAGAACALSEDHKPELPREEARIEAAGGYVQEEALSGWTGYRVNGDLNLSRALGDMAYKDRSRPAHEHMVCGVPETSTLSWHAGDDEFVLLACDGVWECMGTQEAVNFVRSRLPPPGPRRRLLPILEALVDACCANHPMQRGGLGCDNMTAVLVRFEDPQAVAEAAAEGDEDQEDARVSDGAYTKQLEVALSQTIQRLSSRNRIKETPEERAEREALAREQLEQQEAREKEELERSKLRKRRRAEREALEKKEKKRMLCCAALEDEDDEGDTE
eukprot:CAMPEP_0168434374 /NCGR_PEP_ID=MMETSP0228-20121227/39875_1 /TAXON_ID=133427 /ORGANISM="Protoceratium reticulatum, Strain CCCM 535 (=CCMP 1889)" /LENGTH=520 /DNA_ID=CAMNT_0008448533 /DNA_START=72 /DNA_END=1634 /DNA_ORIENTATION=-